jgi:hypothetical protein
MTVLVLLVPEPFAKNGKVSDSSAMQHTPLSILESRPVFNTSAGVPNVQNQSSEAWPPLPVGEMKSYRDLFKSLDKENGILKYDVVLHILLKTGQPTATLAMVL